MWVPAGVLPDAVTLAPKLAIDAGSGFVASEPQKILVGSYSAFEAQFTAVGRGLAAHGVLGAVGGDALTVEVEDSTLWEDREWLSVWPTLAGEQTVDVLAAGAELDEVVFEAVDVAGIVGLQVIGNVSGVGAEGTVIVGVVGLDDAGDMVLYPASSLHRVTPVTRGTRIASFFWVQSMIRDDGARAVLFDLDQAIQAHARAHGIDHALTLQLTNVYHNLTRLHADT